MGKPNSAAANATELAGQAGPMALLAPPVLADLIETETEARKAYSAFFDNFERIEEADMEWRHSSAPRLVNTIGGKHLDALVLSREEGIEEIDKQAEAVHQLLASLLDEEGKQAAQSALKATVADAKARFMAEHDAMDRERAAYIEAERRQSELSAAMWNAADAILAYPPCSMDELRRKARWIAEADREGRLGCESDGEALISSYLSIAHD